LLGYNTVQLWRMRRTANKLMNGKLTTQKEAALKKWMASQQDKFLAKWLKSSSVYPDQVYSKLGLTKLGASAKSSPNYQLYEKYTEALLQRWTNFKASPDTVYKSLRLDKLGAKAPQSPSYPMYEKYLQTFFRNQPAN
nr:Chain A, Avh240 [Phytophthora sojae]6J8L_B Chain B, Avh240 [Phytophthora sojae]